MNNMQDVFARIEALEAQFAAKQKEFKEKYLGKEWRIEELKDWRIEYGNQNNTTACNPSWAERDEDERWYLSQDE